MHLKRSRLIGLTRCAKLRPSKASAPPTRIEGAKLSDAQVEELLTNIRKQSFNTANEQEAAGYAEAMDLVFQAFDDLRLSQNHA